MNATIKRILPFLVCILALTSCRGAALKSLRGLFKSVPGTELVRRTTKTVKTAPKNKKSFEWTRGIDDVMRAVSDSSSFSSHEATPEYGMLKNNSGTSYKQGGNAAIKFKTIDVKIPDIAPNYNRVNLNRNSTGYKPDPLYGNKYSTSNDSRTNPSFK